MELWPQLNWKKSREGEPLIETENLQLQICQSNAKAKGIMMLASSQEEAIMRLQC
jgi:hypothetical protein